MVVQPGAGSGGDLQAAREASSGSEEKSLKELSDIRGAFQGKRRRDMQQKMMASDQISAGWGSYLRSLQTSGERYGSDPTIPRGILVTISCISVLPRYFETYHVLQRFRSRTDI